MYKATVYYLDKDGQPSMMIGNFKSELKAIAAIDLMRLAMENEDNPGTFLSQKIEKVEE
mgnify:CR=1 FL=1